MSVFPGKIAAVERSRASARPLRVAGARFSRAELYRLVIELAVMEVGVDDLAVAARGREQAVPEAVLDLSARP